MNASSASPNPPHSLASAPVGAADKVAAKAAPQWIQSSLSEDEVQAITGDGTQASLRIWQGFMTARLMVAALLLILHALGMYFRGSLSVVLLALCAGYLLVTLTTRLLLAPVPPGRRFEPYWPITLGLDLLVYFLLVWFSQSPIANYTPLLALPPVMSAVLGTRRLAILSVMASSLLMGLASWRDYQNSDLDSQVLQAAVMLLYMLVMFLVTSILQRAARNYGVQQSQAAIGRRLLRLQGRIQDMVVQSVRDGVLVVSGSGRLRAINQAAQQMLHMPPDEPAIGRRLKSIAAIGPLLHLIEQSFADGEGASSEVFLFAADGPSTHLMVRGHVWPSASADPDDEALCLLYLQDMQEVQQRMRTEKLAAMGRMSAAVAHEIRNPLAAIGQAAQLLDEELDQPMQKKLNGMVQDNVQRLGRIVSDVLDIARMQQYPTAEAPPLALDATVQLLCDEWLQQHAPDAPPVHLALNLSDVAVRFDVEHLRRIVVNLLDNAQRHGAQGDEACVIVSTTLHEGMARLQVWSRGEPLPPPVLARLFEPFAAGPSRSTGLGLYICRELCQRHRADMHYQHLPAALPCQGSGQAEAEGNAFFVRMPITLMPVAAAGPADVDVAADVADAADATDAGNAAPHNPGHSS
ncbi:MAG: PAS domain-containing sensor histidine kinase [Brachymonas sp.]|nr:PAS domain-containing sensor histidine kinase [Brachymonas sp.]